MFGRRLAALRAQQGISQYELADRLQLSRGQIANYEQGTREPDFHTLIRLADFFQVSLDNLLGREFPARMRLASQASVAEAQPSYTTEPTLIGEPLSAEEAEYLTVTLKVYREMKRQS